MGKTRSLSIRRAKARMVMNSSVKKSEEKWKKQAVVWELYLLSDLILGENESVCRMILETEVGTVEERRLWPATVSELVEQLCDVSRESLGLRTPGKGRKSQIPGMNTRGGLKEEA